ncbi:MAG TPA: FtsQ-type POTRA domain-containing protein, partial [Anaerolineales bacterium]
MSAHRPLNRAEEVRRRRAEEASKRQQQATQRAYRPMPPVTARGMAHVPAGHGPRGNTRRYQTALGLPQTRVQAPSWPRELLSTRFVAIASALAVGALFYFLWTSPYFHVLAPQVTGNTRIAAEEISAALGVNGQPIFLMRSADLEKRLRLNYPELASAEVTIRLPNQVSVRVTERVPIILWQQGDGYTWVDASGVAFHPHGQVDGLILVGALAAPPSGPASGADPFAPPPYVSPDLVKAIQVLAPTAPPGSPLIYDPHNGLGWADERGWQVFFGIESQDMTLKLRVYQS